MPMPSNEIRCATGGKDITPGTPFDVCRAVNCETAGAAESVTWADGSTSALYFIQGYNPVQLTNISASNLDASGLVALY